MILCGGAAIILLIMLIFWKRTPVVEKVRNPCRIMLVFCILGCLSEGMGRFESSEISASKIARREPGEGNRKTEAFVYLKEEDTEYPLTITIEERKYQKKEEEELLAGAIEEINKTFCGANESMKEIKSDPFVQETYQEEAVSAEWLFSNKEAISPEGKINQQALGEKPEEIEAAVFLSCGETKEIYRFFFSVIPKEKGKKDRITAAIQDWIQKQDQTKAVVELPAEIDGQEIGWREASPAASAEIFGLGILAAVTAAYVQKEQQEKQKQRRKQNLLMEYPEFVSKLSLLLGAGMTIPKALRKINQMHQQKKNKTGGRNAVYEELYQMICKMDNGMGELRAYQEFAEQCGLRPYRKLVSLLISGQRLGSQKLLERMQEEAENVFLERKNAARRLGEEAGTKMLLPMMMMLVIVMGIVVIPAFWTIYGM